MKVIINNKPINLNINYRFTRTDIDNVEYAIERNTRIKHITRIKIYQYVLKDIKSGNHSFMCNAMRKCFEHNFDIKVMSNYDNLLPEFNKINYRNITNTAYWMCGVAWDWENKNNRIKFLEAIKRQCAVEYLKLEKYENYNI